MELVVDTNVLFSSVIKDSASRKLLCDPKLTLYAPEFIIFEIPGHEAEIRNKSGLDENEFRQLMAVLLSRISIVPESEFEPCLGKAFGISPDPEDTPFIALCISKNIPLWSDDKSLKQQSDVKVFSTPELLQLSR